MGLSGSCPLAVHLDLDTGFDSVLKSIGVNVDKPLVRSISLKLKNPEPVRVKCEELDAAATSPKVDDDAAAVKLQKVYKSFRTRRKLADCAVLIERSWWKLLDFAELKHSSISFFEVDKHETALSRWSRARTRAAKVGKGLSENGKAQKLALQHWLEAIDPRHRYGHNLHFYYMEWLNSQSKQPFFYWLDIGEGKEVSLSEKCTRLKLQQQCIKYLGPMERSAYEVVVKDGNLVYKETGELLNTPDEPKGCKWIFVLSTSRTMYVAKKVKGSFQHSSFLAGGATLAAGRIVADDGVLKAVWPHSGHYRPTLENFQDFLSFLRDNVVDLTDVKLDSTDNEDSTSSDGKNVRRNSSANYLTTEKEVDSEKATNIISSIDELEQDENADEIMMRKLKSLKIPRNEEFTIDRETKSENKVTDSISGKSSPSDDDDGYLTALDPFGETEEEEEEETRIPEEFILKRINSHKGMKSFQLGKQLSCKWSTGAGPRIGCVRDYPSGLQSHALEQVHLSPRSKCRLRLEFGMSRVLTPNGGSKLSRSVSGNDYPQSEFDRHLEGRLIL